MEYRFIAAHRQEYPIKTMYRVLDVAGACSMPGDGGCLAPEVKRIHLWCKALRETIIRTARSMTVLVLIR